jgi:hypothetical protein
LTFSTPVTGSAVPDVVEGVALARDAFVLAAVFDAGSLPVWPRRPHASDRSAAEPAHTRSSLKSFMVVLSLSLEKTI